MCIERDRYGGFTLVEMIIFIVVVSVGLAGVLSALNINVQHSADPLQPKQALAIAESYMEEIFYRDYCDPSLPSALSLTGNITSGSKVISGIPSTAGISVGWQIVGSSIPGSTTVTAVNSASQLTVSNNALATTTASPFIAANCESQEGSRSSYNDIRDYNNATAVAVTDINGNAIPGYTVAINVPSTTTTIGGLTARQITVTVTAPNGTSYGLTSYRMPY